MVLTKYFNISALVNLPLFYNFKQQMFETIFPSYFIDRLQRISIYLFINILSFYLKQQQINDTCSIQNFLCILRLYIAVLDIENSKHSSNFKLRFIDLFNMRLPLNSNKHTFVYLTLWYVFRTKVRYLMLPVQCIKIDSKWGLCRCFHKSSISILNVVFTYLI